MEIKKTIKNIFFSRAFEKRTMEQQSKVLYEKLSDTVRQIVHEETDKELEEIRKTCEQLSEVVRQMNAVNLFLQRYYGKQQKGDYRTHFVSYYYEAIYGCANLGDYIQTIATEEAIRKCTNKETTFEYVLRGALTEHPGGTCVMQGWYEHRKLNFLPGPDTRPVWIGTHLCAEVRNLLIALYNTSSIKFSDIGCRDKSTLTFCRSLGLSAYLSRCLTLTLPRREDTEAALADTTYLTDCSDDIIEHLPANVKDKAKRVTQRNYPTENWKDWRESRNAAEQLLEEYRKHARLVVTTALHCAQPCLAMGIPTIFIKPGYDEEERFSSMDGLITMYTIEDLKEGRVNFNPEAPSFEDLKAALLLNLRLTLKETLTTEENQKRQHAREFIANYRKV